MKNYSGVKIFEISYNNSNFQSEINSTLNITTSIFFGLPSHFGELKTSLILLCTLMIIFYHFWIFLDLCFPSWPTLNKEESWLYCQSSLRCCYNHCRCCAGCRWEWKASIRGNWLSCKSFVRVNGEFSVEFAWWRKRLSVRNIRTFS